MKMDTWVHIVLDSADDSYLLKQIDPTGLVCTLNGAGISDLDEFYIEIQRAVPLIRGFGRNLNALVDLIRTFGWGDHSGKSHCLVWRRPEHMMLASQMEFTKVADILVGVSKELLVGSELDPSFDSSNTADWIPTRLDLIFYVASERHARALKSELEVLSDDWADEFLSLIVPVELIL